MPTTPLRISPRAERELLTICEQSEEHLTDAYARLASRKDHVISPKALRAALEQPLAPGVVRALLSQLLGLRSYIESTGKTVSSTVGALSVGIKEKKWPDETYKKWERLAPVIEKFLALDNIITTAKAIELSFDFEHLLYSINILTHLLHFERGHVR